MALTGRPRLRTGSVWQDLISAVEIRSDGPDSRVLYLAGAGHRRQRETTADGSGVDALVASVLPRDGGVGDEARHNTAGSMAWSACSIPSCIGDGARTE